MPARKLNEKWSPSPANLELINKIIHDFTDNVTDLDDWFLKYGKSHRYRLAFDLDYLDIFFKDRLLKVLEVGALPFILTRALKLKGYDVEAVDVEPARMKQVINKFNIEVVKCDIETDTLPYDDNSFDIILFNEVFEHLRINPIYTFKELRRVLKTDGTIFISTPNLLSLKGLYSLLIQKKSPSNIYGEYEKLIKLGHMGHVREYTPTELKEFLAACRFEVSYIIYRGLPKSSTKWKQLTANIGLTIFPSLRRYFSIIAHKIPDNL